MLTRVTLNLIRACVTYGYLVGGTPVFWSTRDGELCTVRSRFDRLRFGSTIFLSAIGTILSTFTLRAYVRQHGFFLKDENAIIRACMLIVALTSNLFIFNMVQHAEEFTSTINKARFVYDQFDEHLKARGETRSKNWCDLVFGFAFLSAAPMPFVAIGIPLIRCDVNIFYGVVPDTWICSQSVAFTIAGFDFPTVSGGMILFASAQMLFLMQVVSNGFLLICLWFPQLFFGNQIMHILNSRSANGVPQKDFKVFMKTYRCFRIIQNRVNLCLGKHFMIGHLPLFSSLFIMCVVSLVKIPGSLLLLAVDIIWTTIYVVHYMFVMAKLWKFSEITEELLRNVRFHRASKLDSKVLMSVKPLYISFGSFGDFNKDNYIFVGNFVVSLTINVLMMQPNGHNQQMRF